jgi:anaphase-promoting complex subunit 6
MEKLLRDWRQDAVNKHQYESAIYIGDKLLAFTSTSSSTVRNFQTRQST